MAVDSPKNKIQKEGTMDAIIAQNLTITKLNSERNFLRFPFFSLSNRDAQRRRKSEVHISYQVGNNKYTGRAKILASEDYIYPTPFDGKVFKAIEALLTRKVVSGEGIENPLRFTSYELLKDLGLSPKNGPNIRKVRESIKRITVTSIDAEKLLHDKSRERAVGGRVFHVFDDFRYRGDIEDDGSHAEKNWVKLSDWYIDNLRHNYVKPIDWEYYKSLDNPTTQRLYELVGLAFFGVFMNNRQEEWGSSYVKYQYHDLCSQLPTTPQRYYSDAQRNLEPALQKLKKFAYFERFRWEQTSKDNWAILIYPGSKAIKEFRENKGIKDKPTEQLEMPLDEKKVVILKEGEKRPAEVKNEALSAHSDVSSTIKSLLSDRDVELTKTVVDLAIKSPDRVQSQVKIYDWIREKQPQLITGAGPGFLVDRIKNNRPAPAGYAEQQRQQSREVTQASARQALIQEYKEWLPALEQEAKLEAKLTSRQWKDQRLQTYIRLHEEQHGEKPTKAKIGEMCLLVEEDYQRRQKGYEAILTGKVEDFKYKTQTKAREQGIEDFDLPDYY